MSTVTTDTVGIGPGSYPPPVVPRFSRGERDRRWSNVRNLMARDKLDVLITLTNSSSWDAGNSNGRYLTSIGGNCAQISVVFPLDGPVTAITGPVPTPAFWHQYQDWVEDVRTGFFNPAPAIVERLIELGFEKARIGIAGLADVARVPDGLVSYNAYRMLEERLPDAMLLNATFLMDEARFVKSDEELEMLRQSVALVEGAFDVLEREARAGVPECVVYGRMAGWLLEQGAEPSALLLWAAGNPLPPAVATLATRRRLEADDMIMIELDAKWGGYLGHGAITTWVGEPDDTAYEMAELQFEATMQCLDAMRPGALLGSFTDICAEIAAGTRYGCKPIIHGRGLGNDAPVLVFHPRDDRTARWPLEANAVFVVKPVVSLPDGSRKLMWGDSVVVTEDGARRLGSRPAPLVGKPWDGSPFSRSGDTP